MRYPVVLSPPENGIIGVEFPDIPEALTQGDGRDNALEMALDALITSLDFYFEDKRPVPAPSRVKRGQDFVELPASVVAKVLLLNEVVTQKVRAIDLANRLGVPKQEVNRLLNLRHATKIDGVAAALKVLGKTLEMSAV